MEAAKRSYELRDLDAVRAPRPRRRRAPALSRPVTDAREVVERVLARPARATACVTARARIARFSRGGHAFMRGPAKRGTMRRDASTSVAPRTSWRWSRAGSAADLKLYLGFAAGVGKTYKMLEEAHALRRRGVDVVLGFIETHGRAETAALSTGSRCVPRKQDRVSRRRPSRRWTSTRCWRAGRRSPIVDELAHTNAPGGRNAQALPGRASSCSTPASTSSAPSTCSTSSRSTTSCRATPACRCARPCPTASSSRPIRS